MTNKISRNKIHLSKVALSLVVFTFAFLIFNLTNYASAHTLKISNGVSVTLHLEDEDKVIVNQPTELEFQVADPKGNFDIKDCLCQVDIRNGNDTKSYPLEAGTVDGKVGVSSVVIFPETGSYTIDLKGTSTKNSFPEFNVNYLINVQNPASNKSTANLDKTSIYIVCAAIIAVMGILAYTFFSGGIASKK